MNERALHVKLKSRLLTQTWTGGSNVVFANVSAGSTGSVKSVVELDRAFAAALQGGMRTPFCLMSTMSADSDPEFSEEPDLIRFQIGCLIATVVPGGAVGEEPYMGANVADSTKSEGQGLAAIAVEVYNAVGKLNALESLTIQCRETGIQGGRTVGQTFIGYRVMMLEAWGTAT